MLLVTLGWLIVCGIWGVWLKQGGRDFSIRHLSSVLFHRGPDDAGVWHDEGNKLWLGHNRLAIQDLSSFGRQPMRSACGRYIIAFNGEIYNHMEIREQLEIQGALCRWKGRSDTETLLEAISIWGVEKALKVVTGMFAFAVWDTVRKKLVLARDRFGEKPIYYGLLRDGFAFSSELKALRMMPGFSGEIDRLALAEYMRLGYVPSPASIYSSVVKLRAGDVLFFKERNLIEKTLPEVHSYWNSIEVAESCLKTRESYLSDNEAVDGLEKVLKESIRGQMVADVPLGAFLSGGIDSSIIVALMQELSIEAGGPPVKTFSIGFRESAYDEAPFARAVANSLLTDHTELYLGPEDALKVIPKLPYLYDEPFADSSQIPTYLVCKTAKEHVTVALSGDGGDELFGGYNRYHLAARLWQRIEKVPRPVRQLTGGVLGSIPVWFWERFFEKVFPFVDKKFHFRLPGEKIHKIGRLLGASNGKELYRGLVSQWDSSVVLREHDGKNNHNYCDLSGISSLMEEMMLLDTVTYLTDDILTKVDRAAMSVSLETRIPFLDHRVFEFSWQLPLNYKIRGGNGKWLLRRLLNRHLPASLVERPKMGFGVPIDNWLRGPLREWADELLSESRINMEGYLNAKLIRKKWIQHLSGKQNWQHQLWVVLMFQAWLETQ